MTICHVNNFLTLQITQAYLIHVRVNPSQPKVTEIHYCIEHFGLHESTVHACCYRSSSSIIVKQT